MVYKQAWSIKNYRYVWDVSRGSFVIRDGMKNRFWEDTWLGDTSLATQYPSLYNIVRTKHVLVTDVLSNVPLNIRFNRTLTWDRWNSWVILLRRLMNVHLSDEPANFKWNLTPTGIFSMKSIVVTHHTTSCCSIQVVNITLVKYQFKNNTSLGVVQ
jgi:hypothetical protein